MYQPKVYISGSISGMPKEEYMASFAKAEIRLIGLGFQPVNPTTSVIARFLFRFSYKLGLRYDMFLLKQCDAIYMLMGWKKSKGSRCEFNKAFALGKWILTENEKDAMLYTVKDAIESNN